MDVPTPTQPRVEPDPAVSASNSLASEAPGAASVATVTADENASVGDGDSGHSGGCWQFRVVPNDIQKFSGDCLFMALSQFLLPEHKSSTSLQFHPVMRNTIVGFLTHDEQTWRRYSIWLKNNHQARIKEFRNYLPDSPCRILHSKIQKAYKNSMLTGGYFGTMAELNAAMELFGFRTTLIQENLSDKKFSVYNIGDSGWHHRMYLLFTGHSDGGHFQLLELLSQQQEIPAGKFEVTSLCPEENTMAISQVKSNENESPSQERHSETKRKVGDEATEDLRKRTKNNASLLEMNAACDETSLTKIEMCRLRSLLMADFSDSARTDADLSDGDGDCGSDTIPCSLRGLPPGMKDSSIYYVYLPPWSGTTFHKVLENTEVEVMEKTFALLDCRNTKHQRRSLCLKERKFVLESEDLYKLKNVTDKGIFVKLRHA